MIPLIGTMIGAYIIVQCVTLATRSGDRAENPVARVFAVFCALGIVFCVTALWQISHDFERETHHVLPGVQVPNQTLQP